MKIYRDNIAFYEAELLRLSKQLVHISLLRLLVFVSSSIVLIYLLSKHLTTPVFIVLPVAILSFAFVIKRYDKTAYQKKHSEYLKKINESEISRERSQLAAFDAGHRFIDQNHPYTSDLDIFGEHSVFQLLNRTTTESGRIRLAAWLSAPAPDQEIHERQKAIKELSPEVDWRQDFQALGMHFQNKKSDYYKLLDWVEKPVVLLKHRHLYSAVAIILSVLSVLSLFLFLDHLESPDRSLYLGFLILVFFVNYLILRKVGPLAEDIVDTSTENLKTLRSYQKLIDKIESGSFESEKLGELQSIFRKGKYSAGHEINRLCSILDFSHQRSTKKKALGGNFFYYILNNFLLLDIHLIIGTEKWKSRNRAGLKLWSEAVSEFEVINSFAGFCYSNPSYTFPEITEKNNYVHLQSVGHPLINAGERICNNFHSEGRGNIVMITGSNMAGKSTFLRAVGVNIVLALAGAPCCAKNVQVANLMLYTSMRTQDNLMKGISSFYAELSRIEKMLKLINGGQNIFFLLDEMFRGTNSEDRHKGGFSLINQLSKLNTSGIIATHDIELATLSENEKLVTNYSFNSEIKEHAMIFSYELQPGICTDFNASELMKKSGIEILKDIPKSEH